MSKIIFKLNFLLFGLFLFSSSFAQDCYQTFLNEGIQAYDALDFEKAINQFKAAQICDDTPANNKVNEWIGKAQNGYIHAIKGERTKAQSLALTAKSIIELEKNDDASKAFRYAQYAWQKNDTPESRFALYDCLYQLESRENRRNFYIRDVKVFENLNNEIRTIGFIDGGKTVYVSSEIDGELLLFDFDGNKIANLSSEVHWYTNQSYSEATNMLLTTEKSNKKHYVNGYHLKDSKLSEQPVFQYPSSGGDVTAIAISKDGERIATCFNNGEIHILNKNGKLLYQLPKEERGALYLSFSDNYQLALSYGKEVKVYNLGANNFELLFEKIEKGMTWPHHVVLSPSAKYLMTAYNAKGNIWDIEGDSIYASQDKFNYQQDIGMFSTDEIHATFGPQFLNLKNRELVSVFPGEVRNMKFSIDKKYLVANINSNVARIWVDQQYQKVNNELLGGHNDLIKQIHFSPDTMHIITGSLDQTFKIWKHRIKAYSRIQNTGRFVQSVEVDGRNVIATIDNKELNIFYEDGEFRESHGLPVNRIVTMSPDGKNVFANVENGFEIWSLDLEAKRLRFSNGISGTDTTHIADFSTDNRVVYFSGENLLSLEIWDMNTKKTALLSGYDTDLIALKWSPDNKHIVAINDYGKLYLWNVEGKPKLIKSWTPHPDHGCYNVSFSNNGQKVVTCGHDNIATVWDLQGRQLSRLIGHIKRINDANFSKDDRFIATASNDGTARIWTSEGELVIKVDDFNFNVQQADFSSDGKYLITRYGRDYIKVWPFDPQLIIDKFKAYGLPDLSDEEKLKYGVRSER